MVTLVVVLGTLPYVGTSPVNLTSGPAWSRRMSGPAARQPPKDNEKSTPMLHQCLLETEFSSHPPLNVYQICQGLLCHLLRNPGRMRVNGGVTGRSVTI